MNVLTDFSRIFPKNFKKSGAPPLNPSRYNFNLVGERLCSKFPQPEPATLNLHLDLKFSRRTLKICILSELSFFIFLRQFFNFLKSHLGFGRLLPLTPCRIPVRAYPLYSSPQENFSGYATDHISTQMLSSGLLQ